MITISPDGVRLNSILWDMGIPRDLAKFITAQAAHETGNFTSRIYKLNNNPFGMKLAKVRKTTATGEKLGHATYKSIESAVEDYILYWNYFKYPAQFKDVHSFVQALKEKGYFEATNEEYENGVKNFYNVYFKA